MRLNKMQEARNDNIYTFLKENIAISDVITKLSIQLEQSGHNLVGNCPTGHPSQSGRCFNVNTQTNLFYCYNCGVGGSIIDLVSIALKIDISASVKWLVQTFNLQDKVSSDYLMHVKLTDEEVKKQSTKFIRHQLYEEVVRWGKELLYKDEGTEVLKYLVEQRKYDIDKLKQTEFFFFPHETHIRLHLHEVFPNLKTQITELPLNGAQRNTIHLAFPYRNRLGIITGIIKRFPDSKGFQKFDKEGNPKRDKDGNLVFERYDSTYETKKEDLFGLDKIKGIETLLILEGYPDAIYLPALGYPGVVALGQGLFSNRHIEGLESKKIKNVILALDNDKVGPTNTVRAIEMLSQSTDIKVFVLEQTKLNPHKDPDEYIRANGLDGFQLLLKRTERGLFWLANRTLKQMDKEDPISKQVAIDKLIKIARYIKDPIEGEEYRGLLKKELNLTDAAIKGKIKAEMEKSRIEDYKKVKQRNTKDSARYVPFIEKKTSSLSYYDSKEDELYLDVSLMAMENILASAEQILPDVLPVLKADFYVHDNERINYELERFNLFIPTDHMFLQKNGNRMDPRKFFPNIYRLLTNLIPNYRERKLFINWIAGILQTREKHRTAWILKGKQGTGKNVLVERIFKPLFGSKQTKVIDDAELQRDFNGWLQNALIIAFNEVAHDNQSRNGINSKIKAIVADSTARINEKNIRAFPVENHANCLFFSNELVPLFIEDGDRRFNIVTTGSPLTSFDWFKKDPEQFLRKLEEEVPAFAQFLTNWNYDANIANTAINNEEKQKMVTACMNRFEEFAFHLKAAHLDWFRTNIQNGFMLNETTIPEYDIQQKRIEKNLAVKLFNEIYSEYPIKKEALSKKLSLYGIVPFRDKMFDRHLYIWN